MSEKFRDWISYNGLKHYLIITKENEVFIDGVKCPTLQEAYKEIKNE